ncbi:MAG: DUF4157 domain-containing protein [Terracidiphilus sp.]|jgi:hypothetical protein
MNAVSQQVANKKKPASGSAVQRFSQGRAASNSFVDNSPFIQAQRQQLSSTFGSAIQAKPKEKPKQLMAAPGVLQAQGEQMGSPRVNNTGLPDQLKSGVESLSGMSMDAVRVHYNSGKPAQLNALAYAQGTNIHVAPGQEKHLPHEAWHVVQQAQGRVEPTRQMKGGVPVNDDKALEHEADMMGARAVQKKVARQTGKDDLPGHSRAYPRGSRGNAIQMAGHAGVMLFARDLLLKRIEKNEKDEWKRIEQLQKGEDRLKNGEALKVFPKIHDVFDNKSLSGKGIEYKFSEQHGWAKYSAADKVGDFYVVMDKLEGGQPFDFKIGTATANFKELTTNYHKSDEDAEKKVKKMARADDHFETRKYGLRDSDRSKKLSNWTRFWRGWTSWFSLYGIKDRVAKKRKEDGGKLELKKCMDAVRNIRDYLEGAKVVYVASSILVNSKLNDAKLIDLAHPVKAVDSDFKQIQDGLLLGANNLILLLHDQNPISDLVGAKTSADKALL